MNLCYAIFSDYKLFLFPVSLFVFQKCLTMLIIFVKVSQKSEISVKSRTSFGLIHTKILGDPWNFRDRFINLKRLWFYHTFFGENGKKSTKFINVSPLSSNIDELIMPLPTFVHPSRRFQESSRSSKWPPKIEGVTEKLKKY